MTGCIICLAITISFLLCIDVIETRHDVLLHYYWIRSFVVLVIVFYPFLSGVTSCPGTIQVDTAILSLYVFKHSLQDLIPV